MKYARIRASFCGRERREIDRRRVRENCRRAPVQRVEQCEFCITDLLNLLILRQIYYRSLSHYSEMLATSTFHLKDELELITRNQQLIFTRAETHREANPLPPLFPQVTFLSLSGLASRFLIVSLLDLRPSSTENPPLR
ncbi:hypothetical protein MPH_02750 [Macrophomina phaseolina MS6]|uniref:Uncharacterized protein n=1 Tax=Macrophomina phaseolina (strain MS6) TaxID=1126212 RepID=K2S4H2_MACPH|nr:hypothetical protein MPH_02750 [Macrophomina phaseolina MS6]